MLLLNEFSPRRRPLKPSKLKELYSGTQRLAMTISIYYTCLVTCLSFILVIHPSASIFEAF